MSELKPCPADQYESETGEKALYRKGVSDYHTLKYVRWLEKQSNNSSMTFVEENAGQMRILLEHAHSLLNHIPEYRETITAIEVSAMLAKLKKSGCPTEDWNHRPAEAKLQAEMQRLVDENASIRAWSDACESQAEKHRNENLGLEDKVLELQAEVNLKTAKIIKLTNELNELREQISEYGMENISLAKRLGNMAVKNQALQQEVERLRGLNKKLYKVGYFTHEDLNGCKEICNGCGRWVWDADDPIEHSDTCPVGIMEKALAEQEE